jgi:hypothetical protein
MEREEVLGKVIFDYRDFFFNKNIERYKVKITKFIEENKKLDNDDFFKKFNEEFAMVDILHKALSREYLSRISSSVKTIKMIVVIYFILSVIAALIILVAQAG